MLLCYMLFLQSSFRLQMSGRTTFDVTREAGDVVVLMEKTLASTLKEQGDLCLGSTLCILAWDVIHVHSRLLRSFFELLLIIFFSGEYIRALAFTKSRVSIPTSIPHNTGIDLSQWPTYTPNNNSEDDYITDSSSFWETRYRFFPSLT